jgi:curli biogenesis system outer membrane secretion channel CsgG
MKRVAALLLLAVTVCPALAAENWVEVDAKGQGSTRDKAIQNGLYLAVCKVQGVAVRSDIARVDVAIDNLDVTRDKAKGTKKVEVESVSANMAGTIAVSESKGLVKSFDIVDEKQVSEDVFEVDLKVRVYDYQSPEDVKRIRLAVFPLESRAEVHRFGGAIIPGRRLGEQFSQYINTMLARNEKFTVLDRDTQDAILKEKNILHSDDAPLEEKMRLGEALGVDYMLVGTIPQAELRVEEEPNPAIGGTTRKFKAVMEVEYRLIVGPTRQIAFSDQLRIKLENAEVKALAEKWKSDDIDYNELELKLVQRAAAQIADAVIEHLYPIRVAAVRDGALILNQGDKRFAVGDVFDVCKVGTDIVDPDTGRSLGKDESRLGAIKITKVLPRISYAEMTEGTASDSTVGAVCHRVKVDTVPAPESRSSNIRQTGSGGVRLPSDDRGSSTITKDK